MDDILFGVKRAYWATFRFSARKLEPFGITPARINLLRVIHASDAPYVTQKDVRYHLGVARSVVCRMLRALEALGLVERGPPPTDGDRRTRTCKLTARGLALVDAVWTELVRTRVVPKAIDASFKKKPRVMRRLAQRIFRGLTLKFGRWGPVRVP